MPVCSNRLPASRPKRPIVIQYRCLHIAICQLNRHRQSNRTSTDYDDLMTLFRCVQAKRLGIIKRLKSIGHRVTPAIQPKFADRDLPSKHARLNSACLGIGAGDVERQAVLIDRKISEFRVTLSPHRIPSLFQAPPRAATFSAGR